MRINENNVVDFAGYEYNFAKMILREKYKIGFFAKTIYELRFIMANNDINNVDSLENIMNNYNIPIFGLRSGIFSGKPFDDKTYKGIRYYYPITSEQYNNILRVNREADALLNEDELKFKYHVFSKNEMIDYLTNNVLKDCGKDQEEINYLSNIATDKYEKEII